MHKVWRKSPVWWVGTPRRRNKMHSVRLPNSEENEAASGKARSSHIKKRGWKRTSQQEFSASSSLEDFSVSDLAKSFALEPHRFTYDFFWVSVDRYSLHGFSADSSGKQTPLYAYSVRAASDITVFFGFFAPHGIATVENGVLNALKGRTGGRTRFCLSQ